MESPLLQCDVLVRPATSAELSQLTHTIAHRIGRYLEHQGLLVRDAEQSYLAVDPSEEGPEDSLNQLHGHSITYRIAVGPHQGRKVFTLQTLPGSEEPFIDTPDGVAGFSLHASVAVKVSERKKLERISGEGALEYWQERLGVFCKGKLGMSDHTRGVIKKGNQIRFLLSLCLLVGHDGRTVHNITHPLPERRTDRTASIEPWSLRLGEARASAETQHRRTKRKQKPTVMWP